MTEPTSRPAARDAEPRVTVAIPTYNRAGLLARCVDAALALSYGNFEILVSDNASTDGTAEVLSRYSDPRLRVVRQATNIGLVPNWNYCLEAASGEYIVFLSDDDIVAPRFLQRVLGVLNGDLSIPITMGLSDVEFIGKDRVAPARPNPRLATGLCDGADILAEWLSEQVSTPMCTTLIRVDRLRALGGFRADLPADFDALACARLLLSGKAGFVNERLGSVGSHVANETSTLAFEAKYGCHRKFVGELLEMAPSVADERKRRRLTEEARRFAARSTVRGLASCRSGGMRLAQALPFLKQSRRDLAALTRSEVAALVRPLAVLLLPIRVSRAIRSMLRPQ
jgi:hypothetical protein